MIVTTDAAGGLETARLDIYRPHLGSITLQHRANRITVAYTTLLQRTNALDIKCDCVISC